MKNSSFFMMLFILLCSHAECADYVYGVSGPDRALDGFQMRGLNIPGYIASDGTVLWHKLDASPDLFAMALELHSQNDPADSQGERAFLLYHSVLQEDKRRFRLIEGFSPGINVYGDRRRTAFWEILSLCGRDEKYCWFLKRVVRLGADVNSRSKSTNETPIELAIYYGRVDIIKILGSAGVDLEYKREGRSLLLIAAIIQNNDMILSRVTSELLRQGAPRSDFGDFFGIEYCDFLRDEKRFETIRSLNKRGLCGLAE